MLYPTRLCRYQTWMEFVLMSRWKYLVLLTRLENILESP